MNILITGGAGFIGSAVVRLAITRGHRVVNLDALTYAASLESLASISEHPNYTFLKMNIRDRGELEITSLLEAYLNDGKLRVERMGRGYAWLDTGTHNSLLDASNFVRTLTERQGLQVGSPDEIAYKLKWITKDQLKARSRLFGKNRYGQYLENL